MGEQESVKISAVRTYATPTFWRAKPGLLINLNHIISIDIKNPESGATIYMTSSTPGQTECIKIEKGNDLMELLAMVVAPINPPKKSS